MGRRSYEIYLTHMFVVIGIFAVFLGRGKPMGGVPLLFVTTIVLASLLSWLVAVTYSEPMNRWLRATADG
jgi:peptidoglycan/LPS O-acetylase OafA/YrhL